MNLDNYQFQYLYQWFNWLLLNYCELIFLFNAIFYEASFLTKLMDYKKKSLTKINREECYEEIDTRLASGWYVDSLGSTKTKKYKTKKVSFKISKKV